MKIKIWSDFVCPFCYIGGKHLETALESIHKDIEVEYMSYELDPHNTPAKGITMVAMLMDKYGMSELDAIANVERVDQMAHTAGLAFEGARAVQANTFKAHKVMQFAKTKDLGTLLFERYYQYHFVEGKDLSDDAVLVEGAIAVGLNEQEVHDVLNHDDFGLSVRNDEAWATQNGVRGVPFYLIDDQVSLSGAQPVEVFKEAINHVISMNFSKQTEGMVCGPDGCVIE
jgi:predicted DsbA family dithiol-disulfide isomerase